MKVLLVHKLFHLTGGAEVFFFETGRILEEQGHEVAYFSTLSEKNQQSGFSQYFVNAPDFKAGNVAKRISAIGQIVYSQSAKDSFKLLLRDFQPDVVHVFAIFTHLSPSVLDACRESRIPVVMSCNDYKHICPNYKLYHHGKLCDDCKGNKFYKAIFNKCCQDSMAYSVASSLESSIHEYLNILRKNVRIFLFAGDFMAKKTEEFWGKDRFKWAKLMNPFDSTKYLPSYDYDDYLLFFGRMVEEKGVDVLLDAMRLAPRCRLVLVGDGPQLELLVEKSRELALENVDFVGAKWGDELDLLLMNARFVVVPSLWHENFPYVIVQAFAMGKAVIGSDRGGIPELIKDGERGYIYTASSPVALAERIVELWDEPDVAVAMGKAAKQYTDKYFNDGVFYSNLIAIYKEATK